jgi:CheY-like chemotaxis protein
MLGEDMKLVFDLAPTLGRIKADPFHLEQVMLNLAANARDAMTAGGTLTMTTRSEVVGKDSPKLTGIGPGPYAVLTVADTGCGMDEATLARMWDPFFTTKDLGKGTGLGLAAVYGTVRQSGGAIEVESEIGKGTALKIYLPIVQAGEGANGRPQPHSPHASETVLLVEEDERVRGLTRHLLAEQGYAVLEAGDGTAALEIASRHPGTIHLLVTDVVTSAMPGPELARRFRSIRHETRVLYLSGYSGDAVVLHGASEGTTDFLFKPFPQDAFVRKVRAVLDTEA